MQKFKHFIKQLVHNDDDECSYIVKNTQKRCLKMAYYDNIK